MTEMWNYDIIIGVAVGVLFGIFQSKLAREREQRRREREKSSPAPNIESPRERG